MTTTLRQSAGNAQSYAEGSAKVPEIMKAMGYDSFREGQGETISMLLSELDVICVLPTGSGKTACGIIPTVALNWRTVIFSPLIALMRDQARGMSESGVRAATVNSQSAPIEVQTAYSDWSRGMLNILIVSPERLADPLFKRAMNQYPPDCCIVDESHTLSQWCDAFRPAYKRIGDFIADMQPKVVGAFTATATDSIVGDIRSVLHMENAVLLNFSKERKNLIQHNLPDTSIEGIASLLPVGESSIIYCQTTKVVEEMAVKLTDQLGRSATYYHGQMGTNDKKVNQDNWSSGRTDIIVATNAFGMGIDKPDVRNVVFFGFPGSLEEYSQGIGRGGRDGKPCQCYLVNSKGCEFMQEFLWSSSNPSASCVQSVYAFLKHVATSDNCIMLTIKDISKQSGIKEAAAAIQTLDGSKVIERVDPPSKIAYIRFDPSGTDNKNWNRIHDVVREGGILGDNGFYQFDYNYLLAKISEVSQSTVRNWINKLRGEGMIEYEPPFAGKITRIIGDISLVDVSALDMRRAYEFKRLMLVRELATLKDEEMGAYVQGYFDKGGLDVESFRR
ncbi:MAG: RecQ family ATP-dependent DNA helicase [Tannerellaceae bacterium]